MDGTREATDKLLMPMALTAENGAKKLMIGEFKEKISVDCAECYGDGCDNCDNAGEHTVDVPIGWDTIKEIYAKAVEHLGERA